MGKKRITICDPGFLANGARAIGLDGERLGESPHHFEWEPADAGSARFVTGGDLKHARGAGQIAWLIEPPRLHPEDYQVAWERRHEFDAIIAHSEANEWGALWYPKGGSRIKKENWGMHKKMKTKNISMICGPKDSMPGHKLRLALAELLGGGVDIYHDNYDKMETLSPYRFSIVLENERTPGFFTEKLIDCISVGTIPIYWGADVRYHHFMTTAVLPFMEMKIFASVLNMATEATYQKHAFRLQLDLSNCNEFDCCEDWIYTHYPELFDD